MKCAVLEVVIVLLLLVITVDLVTAMPTMREFIGNESLWHYLDHWCAMTEKAKYSLVLVDRLHRDQVSDVRGTGGGGGQVLRFLEQRHPQCRFEHFPSIDQPSLAKALSTNLNLKHRHLQVIFDVTSYLDNFDRQTFNAFIMSLNQLYFQCKYCHFPFLVLMADKVDERLHRWAVAANEQVRSNFRATLVSASSPAATTRVAHFRPIVDGCRQIEQVLLPQTPDDFDQLDRQRRRRCNLGGATLSVGVNNVGDVISSRTIANIDFCISQIIPYCSFHKTPSNNIAFNYSIEFELLKVLATQYNFRFRLVDANQSYGSQVNGQWTGVVGWVHNLVR